MIKATYNAKNLNAFEKHLTVKFAGADDMKSITIKGEVLSAEDFAKVAPAAPAMSVATEDKMKEDVVPAKNPAPGLLKRPHKNAQTLSFLNKYCQKPCMQGF